MEFFCHGTKSFVGDSNSLQNLPNIVKASFLDPVGFFCQFSCSFYKSIFLLEVPAMNRGGNSQCGLHMAKISVTFVIPQK